MFIQIVAEISTCDVTQITFNQRRTVKTYMIGEEQLFVSLPDWKMPNGCDVLPQILEATMTLLELPEGKSIDTLVNFDQEKNGFLVSKTWDLTMYEHTVKVKIDVITDFGFSSETELHVVYSSKGPEFVSSIDSLDVQVVTCSLKDEGWILELPAIKAAEQHKVKINLLEGDFSQYFVYIHKKNSIFLSPAKKPKLFKG